jgi:hypothetical protein
MQRDLKKSENIQQRLGIDANYLRDYLREHAAAAGIA